MSFENYGFCDLCVNRNFDLNHLNLFEKFGYTTIAINTLIEETPDEPKKKKKKGETKDKQDSFPLPLEIKKDILENSKLKILQRITIEFSDSSISHKMNQSNNLKRYDIIAVIPTSLGAFQFACSTMDADMITFIPEIRLPFKTSRKLYRQAVDRGLFFEIMYAPTIKDSTAKKNIISTAHTYHAIGKSKNIVLTSSVENHIHLRGVHDVINMGFIFGLNRNMSLESIRDNARKLIIKSQGRRTGRFYVEVSIDNNENKDEKTAIKDIV